jgi:hypothetical protein
LLVDFACAPECFFTDFCVLLLAGVVDAVLAGVLAILEPEAGAGAAV